MMVFSRSAGEGARIGDFLVVVRAIDDDSVTFELHISGDVCLEVSSEVVFVRTDKWELESDSNRPQ